MFQGIPERGIYDNMKTAVDAVKKGKERVVNCRFLTIVSHYLFEADFCNPATGWEKGQIEKDVRDTRSIIWQRTPSFLQFLFLLKTRSVPDWLLLVDNLDYFESISKTLLNVDE